MQMVVDGLLTNYQKEGSGEKIVVYLHGWGDSLATFSDLTKELSKKYTVILFDLPGFGKSQMPGTTWDLYDYAEFVRSALKKLGVKQVYAYVGHSNGGAVAIRGLSKNILTSDKLILLASAGIRSKNKLRKQVYKAVAKTGKVAAAMLPDATRKKLRGKLYRAVGSDMLVVPEMEETFKKTVSQDIQADAKRVHIPTLIVYGNNDDATPPSYGQILHQAIKNSEFHVIDGAGHFVHHDKPGEVNALLEDFLR